MRCLVTGATGFIGRPLCRHLLAQQVDVVALSKSGDTIDGISQHTAVDFTVGQLPNALFEGVDVVYHLAGIAHQQATAEDYERINVDATLKLAHAAEAAGVPLFVFMSSVRAMGEPTPGLPRAEENCHPPGDAYSLSKWHAEEELRQQFADSKMAVLILRPALVCAPDAAGNLAALRNAIGRGLPRPPAVGSRSIIARNDLLALLWRVANDSWQGVSTYIVCDRRACSFQEMYDHLAHAKGIKMRRPMPIWLWRRACGVLQWRQGTARGATIYDTLFGYDRYDSSALCERLDWHPTTPLSEALTGAAGKPR